MCADGHLLRLLTAAQLLPAARLRRALTRPALPTLDGLPDLSAQDSASLATAQSRAGAILEQCQQLDIRIIAYGDTAYPPLLARLRDAPPLLYVQGNVAALTMRCVAVVGSRKADAEGLDLAGRCAFGLAAQGCCVVSGLAAGCDTCAHQGALAHAQGRTVAVLAHGQDMVFPEGNRGLLAHILEQGGASLSEYPPGTAIASHRFVQRNRLQSGLSQATVVVQTPVRGGTMHTARFCHRQGRALFAFKPQADLPETEAELWSGNNQLLAQGMAQPLDAHAGMEQVLAALGVG